MPKLRLRRDDREVIGAGAAIFAFLAVVLAFGAIVVAGNALTTSNDAKEVAAVGGAGTKVTLTEFAIEPAMVTASKDGTIAVTNAGAADHNLSIKGTDRSTPTLKPGESGTLSLKGLPEGEHTIICTIPGHESSGMTAMLHIGAGGASGTESTENALRAVDPARNVDMKQQIDDYVAQLTDGPNTKGVGNQLLEPTILADGTKEFALTAKIVDWEVEPGRIVRAWTYNGQVPGPVIKVADGERVRIVLTNDLPQSTAIHFHGIDVPNAMDGVPYINQDPVTPGKKFTYEFVARGPAVGMYHSHDYAVTQIPDGMAGAFIIGDEPIPDGYGPVTQEIPMMLNDAGAIGYSLNGKSFPATAPIIAAPGETVEIHYLNEGLTVHPMHLHGMPQLVIAKDGFPLDTPYLADTVLVAPGERYTVLMKPTAEQLGVWAYHCHILNHAEKDDGMMFGMVTTFIVQEPTP